MVATIYLNTTVHYHSDHVYAVESIAGARSPACRLTDRSVQPCLPIEMWVSIVCIRNEAFGGGTLLPVWPFDLEVTVLDAPRLTRIQQISQNSL
jgi:hypothetical protein